jgi:hypothetical protein
MAAKREAAILARRNANPSWVPPPEVQIMLRTTKAALLAVLRPHMAEYEARIYATVNLWTANSRMCSYTSDAARTRMLLPSLKDDKFVTSVLDQFTGMHSAKFGNGSLRATHQRLVADGRRLTSPLLVSELTSATGTGAALASFQEQIAITLLHRDQDFATVTCVIISLTGISSGGATRANHSC